MKISLLSISIALVLATACKSAPNSTPVFHRSPDTALAALPFSEAVEANGFLFVAGQIGVTPGTLDVVKGGMAAEAKQTMENVRAVLERHGCTFEDVVKATVFLADMQDWPAFNELYRTYFPKHFPARSALGANGLARGAKVELEVIAVLPTTER
ncbi:MAG: RidA family protein [Planctomycetes bacterium]|nr:RidA family protein [Planctomycetota bacterium]